MSNLGHTMNTCFMKSFVVTKYDQKFVKLNEVAIEDFNIMPSNYYRAAKTVYVFLYQWT